MARKKSKPKPRCSECRKPVKRNDHHYHRDDLRPCHDDCCNSYRAFWGF